MNFKQWLLAEELKSANAPNISLTPKAKPIDVESNLRILKNNQRIAALGRHFKDNDGKEPHVNSPLGQWLYNKRKAFLDHENMQKNPNYPRTTSTKWYDTDLEVGKNAGLPDDWHTNTEKYKPENKLLQDFKKINDENIKELGRHFKNPKNKGKEPHWKSDLGQWLYNKRKAFRDYENIKRDPNYPRTSTNKWYDTDLEVGKNAGLPDDWHLFTDKYKPESIRPKKDKEYNDQKIIELGDYFNNPKNKGQEPNVRSPLGKWLWEKRRAFRDFQEMKKNPNYQRTTSYKWYDTDIEVGKYAKLPDDWHLPVEKQKVSQGAKFVRNILDDLNIEHIAEFRDRFCLGKTGQCLPFDYSFEHNDQEYFIEYHGGQHYYPVNFGSSKNRQEHAKLALENFKNTQYRDKLKYNYCKQNKFPFLVIPYWTPFSDIKEIIEEFLKHDEFDKIFANPKVPYDLKEKHKQIYKKYYDMSINIT